MPRLLLRALGAVHLIAFVSLWVQIEGLVGSRGILPAQEFFGYLERAIDPGWLERLARVPSLFWLTSADAALHAVCAAGVVLSLAAIAGLVTAPVFGGLWLCYLSLVWAGQTFLSFQWDTLLLEATICAIVLAPLRAGLRSAGLEAPDAGRLRGLRTALRAAPETAASRPGVWLFRLLVVKLMFLSGAVKLLSLDATWWQLTALDYHYGTQPLPVAASWYAHHLPDMLHRLSVALMFAVELVVPWFVFSRRLRLPGVALLLALQVLIAATGNYGFFNLLTAVLCLSWLDRVPFSRAGVSQQLAVGTLRRGTLRGDSEAESAGGREARAGFSGSDRGRPRAEASTVRRWPGASRAIRAAMAGAVLCVSLPVTARELTRSLPRGPDTPPAAAAAADLVERVLVEPAAPVLRAAAPFRSINGYGLFRAMTTSRPEIAVETSPDGQAWRELEFRFKPGDTSRSPRAAFPHMPRLDWQMWFAALDPGSADWLGAFVQRLFEGEPAVLRLLGRESRLAGAPPAFIRLRLHDYSFTEPGADRWWQRQLLYDLSPVLEREAFLEGSAAR